MNKEELNLILSNYITIHNPVISDHFINTVKTEDINKMIGKSVSNYIKRREVDAVIEEITSIINDIDELEKVYENVEGFVWNDKIITNQMYNDEIRHRSLYRDENFFLRTKEEEISLLIALIQLKYQYSTKAEDEKYYKQRDMIIENIILCRAKFVLYKQRLALTSANTKIELDHEKFEKCGIYFQSNKRNENSHGQIDFKDLKNSIQTLKDKGILLKHFSENQKEVIAVELLSPGVFTKIKDQEEIDDKYNDEVKRR